jgi:hypothetical protein
MKADCQPALAGTAIVALQHASQLSQTDHTPAESRDLWVRLLCFACFATWHSVVADKVSRTALRNY